MNVSTIEAHWGQLGTTWDARAQRAANWLKDEPVVADIGCGLMSLKQFLPPATRYIGVDIVPRDAETVVVDLNSSRLPKLNTRAAAALGLLEYIHDASGALSQFAAQFETMVVSYNHFWIQDIYWALRGGGRPVTWVNRYRRSTFRRMMQEAGFEIVVTQKVRAGEDMYLLKRK